MTHMLNEIETLQQEAVRELHDELRAARVELEKREREYRYRITSECLQAISYAAEAGNAPGAAEAYLDDALRCLRDAKQYAILLGELPLNPTKCPHCGTVAWETVCHVCKEPRIGFNKNAAPQETPEQQKANG